LPKFPEPPTAAALARIVPHYRILAAGAFLWRVYFQGGTHPASWNTFRRYGPTSSRFDHHLPPPRLQERAVLYGAESGRICLAEVFQKDRLIDRELREPWLAGFTLDLPLRLLDLTGLWPTRAGASMALNSGPRPRARRWSQVIYEAYPDVQGVAYPSSMHGNHLAVVLYERALSALPSSPVFHRPLLDLALLPALRQIARDIGYGLI